MKDIDKAIVILKELLYETEKIIGFGIDEELAYAINHLKAYKEKENE